MAHRRSRPKAIEPRLYSEARVEEIEAFNHKDEPLRLGSTEEMFDNGGWARFVLPTSNMVVHLKVRTELWREKDEKGNIVHRVQNASPQDALREWFMVRKATRRDSPNIFDVRQLLPFWNYGTDRPLKHRDCGSIHLQGRRRVSGYPVNAHQLWEGCDCRGPNPADVHAALDPENRLPFMTAAPPEAVPAENRWIHAGIDLASPIDEQIKEIKDACRKLQTMSYAVAGLSRPRAARSESSRDTIIFTMHYSAGLTVPEIAEQFFSDEDRDAAIKKTKKILERTRKAVRAAGLDIPRFRRRP